VNATPKVPTQEDLKRLFHYDPETGNFIRKVTKAGNAKAGMIAGAKSVRGGIIIRMFGNKDFRAHRLAWLYMTGEFPPDGLEIDHINCNPEDNRWCNLRLATKSQNKHNTRVRKNNTHGFKGVSFVNGRWMASIRLNWKRHYLGCFATPEQAAAAYAKAAHELHGEFARTA
jgi:hypothetical protein